VSKTKSARIQDHFADVTDPRRRKVTYPLINVMVIAVCAVICGADDFVAIAEFGEKKRHWFRGFSICEMASLARPLQRHFCGDQTGGVREVSVSWITAVQDITDGEVIAIDGKTLRRSFDAASSKAAIHMVSAGPRRITSAWDRWSWTQRATRSPRSRTAGNAGNLRLFGTIDAMGCQTRLPARSSPGEPITCWR